MPLIPLPITSKDHKKRPVLSPLVNTRKSFEKRFQHGVELIHRSLDRFTTVSRHQGTFSKQGEDNHHLDLQQVPFERSGRWWAEIAFQTGTKMNGLLIVQCDVPFEPGEIADAMIDACAGAGQGASVSTSETTFTHNFNLRKFVLYVGEAPPPDL